MLCSAIKTEFKILSFSWSTKIPKLPSYFFLDFIIVLLRTDIKAVDISEFLSISVPV